MKPFLAVSIAFSIVLTTLVQAQSNSDSNATVARPTIDTSSVIVQLKGDPLSTSVKTKPPQGKKIDFDSNSVKSYRAQLSALRNNFRKWLKHNAPKAKITGEFDISLNAVAVQLNGVAKATIEKAPLAERVEYQGIYYPNIDDPDLGIIHAIEAWAVAGGPANAGAGVKAAIIDTGIDINHPCFNDAGYPAQTQLGDRRFTNNKVIVAKVFNNKAGNQGLTPEAIQAHGTHVAGTCGCNAGTPATVDGVAIPYAISGVAPRVLLGNYNVFPNQVGNVRSEDLVNALDAAYADGFDVANMSIGGGFPGAHDLVTNAVDDLDQANMVVAVAAGNSGPGHFTIESPGSAERALTAGASSVGHFIGSPVSVNGSTFGALAGDFATVTADLTAPLGVVFEDANLGFACSALPANSLAGKIAVISRGTCTFSTKIRNAQDAGAVAVLIVNNIPGTPTAMGQDGTANQPTIPAYMVSLADKEALVADDGFDATIGAALTYILDAANNDFMASFSSQGPTDVDFRVKPDVVAPGVNVLSSIPVSFCNGDPCFDFFNGTSMATPHLAGSAAVVRGLHPDWSAAQVRSAIVNTADQGVLKKFSAPVTVETDVNVIGAGRDNLLSAVNATVAIDPVSISFGAVPSGSGQTQNFSATLTNLSGGAGTFSIAAGAGGGGVGYTVSPSSVSLAPGASGTLTVTMSAVKGAAAGSHSALLTIGSGGSEVAHAVVFTFIK